MPSKETQRELNELNEKKLVTNSSLKESGRSSGEIVNDLVEAYDETIKTVDKLDEILGEKNTEKVKNDIDKISFDTSDAKSVKEATSKMETIKEDAIGLANKKLNSSLKEGQKETKAFVTKVFGNTAYFLDLLDNLKKESYKEEKACLPTEYLEKLFSRKNGALMAMCKLEKKFSKKILGTYRRYCNTIVKDYEKLKNPPSKDIKNYNKFIDKSSKLAWKYINNKKGSKLKRLNKINMKDYDRDKYGDPMYYSMSMCKLAFMCMVAVCSKDSTRSSKAKIEFYETLPTLRSIVG